MSKERFLKLYVNVSILVGLLLLVSMFAYVLSFPSEFYGLVQKSIFQVTLETYQGDTTIFNTPLVIFSLLLFVNLFIVVRIGSAKELESKSLQEVAIYNTLFTIMLLAGQVVFFLLIPDRINGVIRDLFVFVEMPLRTGEIVNVVNVNYLIALVYIGYNVVVALKNIPEKEYVEEIDEEVYEEEFFEEMEQEEK